MTEVRLDGRVAVVTGAGRGIGRCHALLLAERGAKVVVNDLGAGVDGQGNAIEPAKDVVEEIIAAGGSAVTNADDISTFDGAQSLIDTTLESYGRADIIVNNAGILRDSSFVKMTPAQIDSVIAVHLRGSFAVLKAAWPSMRDNGYGRIVNTLSDSGVFGNFGQANYGAAKTGLIGLTRVLALEGAKYDIKANGIAPVGATRMTESLMTAESAATARPEQVAALVAYLASDECPSTGEFYQVRRGRVRRIVIGLTEGFTDLELTPETVRDNWDEIVSTDALFIPPAGTSV